MMNGSPNNTLKMREAVLRSLHAPSTLSRAYLGGLSHQDWRYLLPWLDTSGLALYLYSRMTELELCHMLPPEIYARLQQNLADNTIRMSMLISEAIEINRCFDKAGICYVNLKGISLWPNSVPNLALRSQLDVDVLVAEHNAASSREVLEGLGYQLHAYSGRSWEFKSSANCPQTLSDLYRALPCRSVELHIEPDDDEADRKSPRLRRMKQQRFQGMSMPTLCPTDIFIAQAQHLFKHMSSEFTRASWLIEYWRHVTFRANEEEFWNELEIRASEIPGATLALGMVTLLASRLLEDSAPERLRRWTVDALPPPVRLWVEVYGGPALLANFPGSKLYLLLQQDTSTDAGGRSRRSMLIPRHLPPAIAPKVSGERLRPKLSRHLAQCRYVLFRLRFHLIEGMRYLREASRWQRRLSECSR